MDIIYEIEKEVKEKINEYKINSEDNYDFWNEHIKYVYEESKKLAKIYNADKKEHHINGKKIADEILTKYNYSTDKKEQVLNCVYNHRSSKNAITIEELCVADADILAHFDNIPMLFNSAFNRNNIELSEVRKWMKECFEKDYNDLSDKTKEIFKDKYKMICEIVLGL